MAQKAKTYQFSKMKREAERKREKSPRKREPIPPFIIDDVTPHIVITEPDTVERMLTIADFVGMQQSGQWDNSAYIPLLRALCGDQFGRVWMMVKDDPDTEVLLNLINALFDHFSGVLKDVREAEEDLPGGSGDSSN
jgi:hypothetical protein